MAKKKLSRDQKRKQKLQKRAHANLGATRQDPTERLVTDTERVIHETFITYGRQMYDADVLEAVNQLVVDVQRGTSAKIDAAVEPANATSTLIRNIKQRWSDTKALDSMPSLVAAQAMQALAKRIDGIRAPGESHSYLRFLQGTQQKAVLAAPVGAEGSEPGSTAMLPAGDWSPDEARLLPLGLTWLRSSSEATWGPFQTEATRMNEEGQPRAVANVSQYLYGLVQADPVEKALRPLLDASHNKVTASVPSQGLPA